MDCCELVLRLTDELRNRFTVARAAAISRAVHFSQSKPMRMCRVRSWPLADRQLLAVEMRDRTFACLWSVSDPSDIGTISGSALTMRREFLAFLLAAW
jgi:hypothetical protein